MLLPVFWSFSCGDSNFHAQKSAMKAVVDSRAMLERASDKVKAIGTIVFSIKRLLERQGFTEVSSNNENKRYFCQE